MIICNGTGTVLNKICAVQKIVAQNAHIKYLQLLEIIVKKNIKHNPQYTYIVNKTRTQH